jgi:DNA processing protein
MQHQFREDARDWLVLERIPGVGPISMTRLIEGFGSPGAALKAKAEEICLRTKIPSRLAGTIAAYTPCEKDIIRDLKVLSDLGAGLLTRWDSDYPENLVGLYDPPALLFVRGNIVPEDSKALAMVGTRNPSQYGVQAAARIAQDLAREGVTIVSGLARGIDTVCHRAALSAGGRTIGVLGCGIDVAYPPQNKGLIEEVAAAGAVISEFRPGTSPLPTNFFRRNRIVSGLSKGVLVVEAGLKSGSLITANHAYDQNRDVSAVPGNIFHALAKGPHHLIRQGALLVESARDVLDAIFNFAPKQSRVSVPRPSPQSEIGDAERNELSEEQRRVLDSIDLDPTAIDVLCESLSMDAGRLAGILLELELGGFIRQYPGKLFCRVRC